MNLLSSCVIVLMSIVQQTIPKISLEDYGWSDAATGKQRADVIYRAQRAAVRDGGTVDYSGLKEVDLEITEDFNSIPLTGRDDFCGVVFNVTNNAKDISLFRYARPAEKINVPKSLLDGDDFTTIPELMTEECMLCIEDDNPWVDNRVGRSYGFTRKDLLMIRNGRSLNRVSASYDNEESRPKCSVFRINGESGYVRNFTLNRKPGCKHITACINTQGQCHLIISDITVNTPESNLDGDRVIQIRDCADVTLKNIVINGTYSTTSKYGYGFSLNNTWNVVLQDCRGQGKWGVMGTYNVNNTQLKNCDLNRFDVHCYGRDVYLTDCRIDGGPLGWYSGGSSVYGVIQYERCIFTNTVPIAYGDSYKTSVGAEVLFKDCVFNVTKDRSSIFSTNLFKTAVNPRKGLSQRCLPNITILGMTVNVPKDVHIVSLYNVPGVQRQKGAVGYFDKIVIEDMVFVCEDEQQELTFRLFSSSIPTETEPKVEIRNLTAPGAVLNVNVSSDHSSQVNVKDTRLKKISTPSSRVKLSAERNRISQ